MDFRRLTGIEGPHVRVRIFEESGRLLARMDRGDAEGMGSWGKVGLPQEILGDAAAMAIEQELPLAVQMKPGAQWNEEWGTLSE